MTLKMKLNEQERQTWQFQNFWQQEKHAKLYFDLLQASNRAPLVALGFMQKGPSFLHLWYSTVGEDMLGSI